MGMTTRPGRRASVALALVLAPVIGALARPASVLGQDVFAPSGTRWQPGLDTLVLALAGKADWREFEVGDVGASLFGDFMLLGAPTSATSGPGLTAQLAGTWVFGERLGAVATAVGSVGLTAGWWFDSAALGVVAVGAEAYLLPREDGEASGVELSLRAKGVEIPWGLEERNPTLSVAIYRDFGRLDAARADLDADVNVWIQNVQLLGARETGGHLEAGVSWAEVREGPAALPQQALDAWTWRAGVRLGLDFGVPAVLLRLGARDLRGGPPRAFAELALRIWPDAAPVG